eukprot:jgi/Botrbrau1/14983/Bobra.0018s0083.1
MLNDDLDEDPAARRERNFEFLRRFIDEWLTRTQKSLVEGTGSSCRPDSVDADELYLQPCKVVLAALDYQTPQGLFQSPNAAFNKLATVLAYLVHELNDLVRQMEQDVFPQLLMFGEGMAAGGDASGLLEGSTQVALAKALPAFRRAALVIERLKTVTAALLAQLGASSAEHARKATILRGEAAVSGFWAVARACGVLARLDLLTGRNPALLSAFSMFQRSGCPRAWSGGMSGRASLDCWLWASCMQGCAIPSVHLTPKPCASLWTSIRRRLCCQPSRM